MSSLEKTLLKDFKTIEKNIFSATPGFCLQVYHKGKKKVDLRYGKTFSQYDLASLTKAIFTVPALLLSSKKKFLNLNDPLSDHLNWYRHKQNLISDIMSHTAGHKAWRKYYLRYKSNDFLKRREELKTFLKREPLYKSKKPVYSDLDFLYLGFLLEQTWSTDLNTIWQEVRDVWNLKGINFNLNNRPQKKKSSYGPTDNFEGIKRVLRRGVVNDGNCFALGGVSTHAGLFGSINDVSQWALGLRSAVLGKEKNKSLEADIKKIIRSNHYGWGLGLMRGNLSWSGVGRLMNSKSLGHLGYTGASAWWDPKNDLTVTLIANRYQKTKNQNLWAPLRPQIHDMVISKIL